MIIINYSVSFCQNKKLPFKVFDVGEQVEYDAYYNLSFLWVKAGVAKFSVKSIDNSNQILLEATATTLPQYDWIFKVRDTFTSTIDSRTILPYNFRRSTSEGGYWVKNKFNFDYSVNKVNCFLSNKDRQQNIDIPIVFCLRDVLSAVYYCRTIDYSYYQIGEKIPMSLVIEGCAYPVYLRFLGYENLTLKNGKSYNTIKFSVKLVEGTIFSGGENLYVYVSNDKRRVPVYVEGKILVGSVKAIIKE